MAKTFNYIIGPNGEGRVALANDEDDKRYGEGGIPDPVDPTGPKKWVGKPKNKKSKKA